MSIVNQRFASLKLKVYTLQRKSQ